MVWQRPPPLVRDVEDMVQRPSQCCRLVWRRPPCMVARLVLAFFQVSVMHQALVIIQVSGLHQVSWLLRAEVLRQVAVLTLPMHMVLGLVV